MADMRLTGVDGMRAFLAKMKAMDAGTPKMVKGALNEVAEIVVADAKRRAPKRSGALARSIRANSTTGKARISEGSRAVLYAGFIDYGGTTGKGHRPRVGNSGSVKRRFIRTGRILYPAYNANRAEVERALKAALVKLGKEHGVGVE